METFAEALSSCSVFLIRETSSEPHFYFSGLSWQLKKKKNRAGCAEGYRHYITPCVLQIPPKV